MLHVCTRYKQGLNYTTDAQARMRSVTSSGDRTWRELGGPTGLVSEKFGVSCQCYSNFCRICLGNIEDSFSETLPVYVHNFVYLFIYYIYF